MTQTPQSIWAQYGSGRSFNTSIGLYDTVEQNENFFLDNQWVGVQANGLPTPVFNFIKQIVKHSVSSLVTDNIKIQASVMNVTGRYDRTVTETVCNVVNGQLERICEDVKLTAKIREVMQNCAVDGDGCFYAYFDTTKETGQFAPGDIALEIVENTRVIFGNPNNREVNKQPWIIIARREMVEDVKRRADEPDKVQPDSDDLSSVTDTGAEDKVTVLLKMWREYEKDGRVKSVMACECTQSAVVRGEWNTGLKVYPLTWINWDYVLNRYHGQALVTGLIHNQMFVNKLFAMTQLSLMTSAYPKILYDKNRIKNWDNRVGAAIPVTAGGTDISNVAKIMDPAQVSPQISQFIELAISYTKDLNGASDAALGNVRPDNTSAIVAIQRAAGMVLDLVKQNLFQFIEDFGRVCISFMAANYGKRFVELPDETGGMSVQVFDFSILKDMPLSIKLDVGAASYFSEIAGLQTLDNLLMQGKIDTVEYLERVPNGMIPKLHELVENARVKLAQMQMMAGMAQEPGASPAASPEGDIVPPEEMPIPVGKGYGELQRAINETATA